ncbi:hypothetical protein [Pectinatus frisingensis]|uniref:hypothetical protein n=1 Tax=Pectinatus frisingensis TaxID=865 RepID=UPI0018C84779|nr:hypothetical protein [Pectinatus frisingensis]
MNYIPEILKRYFNIGWDETKNYSEPFLVNGEKGICGCAGMVIRVSDGSALCSMAYILADSNSIKTIPQKVKPIWCNDGQKYIFVNGRGILILSEFTGGVADFYLRKAGNMFPPHSKLPQEQIDEIVADMKSGEVKDE